MAHRLSSTKTLHSVTRHRPVLSRSAIRRTRCEPVSNARFLWWWGRHGNEWSSSFDEDLEEKMRRQQRILRHRYSKMLRRRAMWERESALRFSWPLRMSGRWLGSRINDAQDLSSSQAPRAKVEEHDDAAKKKQAPWTEFHEDFESFRKAVDKAIERDPYGTLFGRRLQSPPSANNSSWTSFSWIFDPKEIKEDKNDSRDNKTETQARSEASKPPTQQADTIQQGFDSAHAKRSAGDSTEYEYDPISMRKVPKVRNTTTEKSAPELPRKSLFDTLFGENGFDIPVKTYKPPKVYGYTGATKATTPPPPSPPKDDAEMIRKGLENSRKREFLKLKASTLGNNIDTTAEYGGKYQDGENLPPVPQVSYEEPPTKRVRESAAPDDSTPLFSGTTYEGKSSDPSSLAAPNSTWLRTEGFSSVSSTSNQTTGQDASGAVNIPVKKFTRIQPSLDRMRLASQQPSSRDSVKLQPALGRLKDLANQAPSDRKPEQHSRSLRSGLDEKTEDLDLLRASDVRAKMKTAGTLKQDVERLKEQARQKLEADYLARQKGANAESIRDSALARSMTHVWRHVGQYPNGIVARTMRSMGIFNDNFKKYRSPDKPSTDLTKKLVFNDESLSKVSTIYKKPKLSSKPGPSFDPSPEVMKAEAHMKQRRVALQQAQIEAEKHAKTVDQQAAALGSEIKEIYESEYGIIDIRHRQPLVEAKTVDLSTSGLPAHLSRPHPLQTATVKEGVQRYPEIEAHVSEFEPAFAKIVDQAKSVKRNLHEVKIGFNNIKAAIEDRQRATEEAKRLAATETASLEEDESAYGLDEPVSVHRPYPTAPIGAATPIPNRVEPPIFARDGSPVWEDEQPPPISELKLASYKAPYVMLKYNAQSNRVEAWERHVVLLKGSASRSPLSLVSQLDHFSEFLKHFPALESSGYSLVTGRRDALIFKRGTIVTPTDMHEAREVKHSPIPTEAAAAAHPIVQELPSSPPPATSFEPTESQKIEAAKVLDEIPIEITPTPGPAAPTAPPSSPSPSAKRAPSPKPQERIRRQEDVFSGTIKPATIPSNFKSQSSSKSTYNPIDPEISSPRATSSPPKDGLFKRFTRAVRRVLLTAVAFAGGAYAIGVVAEGIGAQEQVKRVAASEDGPRRKVVVEGYRPRTRPGIFSTESSR